MAKERQLIIDGFRGYAIICIVALHFLNHFISIYPTDYLFPSWLNKAVWETLYFVFEGKSYTVFALLLGVTYGIQYTRRKARGESFNLRFVWRMLGLVIFGYINALIFPGGDPLVSFALSSVILIVASFLPTKGVLLLAGLLLVQPIEIYHILNYYITGAAPETKNLSDAFYVQLAPYIENGNIMEMFKANVTIGMKACLLWAYDFGRVTQTPGLFCLGYWLYITGFFNNGRKHTLKRLPVVLVIAGVLFCIRNYVPDMLDANVQVQAKKLFTAWYNLAGTGILSIVVLYLLQKYEGERLSRLYSFGKMSLTNYIGQNLVGSFILLPWGLNLGKYFDVTSSLLLALVIACCQIYISSMIAARYKHGPLEGIWHKWTWIGTNK
ncbi:DUF418 domain-containing protein [Phocaeicola sp. HCN-40430]|uniref:DUF418 domain-containing protein n=1 Tax=Phocaeicola sp. HCN-40430 TaxID=3134664 RepID=UPI0030BFF920